MTQRAMAAETSAYIMDTLSGLVNGKSEIWLRQPNIFLLVTLHSTNSKNHTLLLNTIPTLTISLFLTLILNVTLILNRTLILNLTLILTLKVMN